MKDGGVRPQPSGAQSHHRSMNFDRVPRLVFWETTKACPLACVHCRATAQCHGAPGELTTEEGKSLLDELASAPRPTPILILTGGDCLQRPDLDELTAYAKYLGVPVAISPSVSPSLNTCTLSMLRTNGVRSASVSLDGAFADTHEQVRQIHGHFSETMRAIALLQEHGFTVQVNSAVMAQNVRELADMAALLVNHDVSTWEVFFLIGVGRGQSISEIESDEYEDVCHFLVDAAQYGMAVRTVEAPFFRRVRDWRRDDPTRASTRQSSSGSDRCTRSCVHACSSSWASRRPGCWLRRSRLATARASSSSGTMVACTRPVSCLYRSDRCETRECSISTGTTRC